MQCQFWNSITVFFLQKLQVYETEQIILKIKDLMLTPDPTPGRVPSPIHTFLRDLLYCNSFAHRKINNI